jgi:Transcriptional Coactivator p15 (PC4)
VSNYRKTDRKMPVRECAIAENEPIEIAKFWKSGRDRKNSIVIAIKSYEGHTFLDCRLFGTNAEGQTVPTAKGVTIGMLRLSEFLRAIQKAHAEAVKRGLLDDGAIEP